MVSSENASYTGFGLLAKPTGISSFNALSGVKRAFNQSTIGHTGTLDCFASGLLILLVGNYTKLMRFFLRLPKTYRAVVYFGAETTTLDPEGQIVAEAKAPEYSLLLSILPQFIGSINQTPPAYSAVHTQGTRSYLLARSGKQVQLSPRPVSIYYLNLVSYENNLATIDISCSSGTYIRSLARDLAAACSSKAYLTALKRLSIGTFCLANAYAPDMFTQPNQLQELSPQDAITLKMDWIIEPELSDKTTPSYKRENPNTELAIFNAQGKLQKILLAEPTPNRQIILRTEIG